MLTATTILDDALSGVFALEDESIDFIYIDPPFNTGRPQGDYDDRWESPQAHADWLAKIIREARCKMKDSASIAVHCDWRSCHHVRLRLDEIFGVNNFTNHVVWCYSSGGASKRHFSRKHDDILIYAKTPRYKFNVQREPYPHDYGDRPGFHPDGRIMNDWWQISIMATNSKERCGYATQKPVALAHRLIEAFTDPDDIVLDFFCGSGTTGVAAHGLGRRSILIDKNPAAISLADERIRGVTSA